MVVSAIQNNNTKKSGNINYLGAATLGGLTGYALKYILPITPQEKDANFKAELAQIEAEAKQTRINDIEAIRKIAKKDLAQDTFISLYDKGKLDIENINNLDEPLKIKVKSLFFETSENADYLLKRRTKSLQALVKGIRPTVTFAAIGVFSAISVALYHNITNIIANRQENSL